MKRLRRCKINQQIAAALIIRAGINNLLRRALVDTRFRCPFVYVSAAPPVDNAVYAESMLIYGGLKGIEATTCPR